MDAHSNVVLSNLLFLHGWPCIEYKWISDRFLKRTKHLNQATSEWLHHSFLLLTCVCCPKDACPQRSTLHKVACELPDLRTQFGFSLSLLQSLRSWAEYSCKFTTFSSQSWLHKWSWAELRSYSYIYTAIHFHYQNPPFDLAPRGQFWFQLSCNSHENYINRELGARICLKWHDWTQMMDWQYSFLLICFYFIFFEEVFLLQVCTCVCILTVSNTFFPALCLFSCLSFTPVICLFLCADSYLLISRSCVPLLALIFNFICLDGLSIHLRALIMPVSFSAFSLLPWCASSTFELVVGPGTLYRLRRWREGTGWCNPCDRYRHSTRQVRTRNSSLSARESQGPRHKAWIWTCTLYKNRQMDVIANALDKRAYHFRWPIFRHLA